MSTLDPSEAGESAEAFVALTLVIEEQTGYDSVPTIERIYDDGGVTPTYECVFPGCTVRRKDAVAMWFHVHCGPSHGPNDALKPYAPEIHRLDPRSGSTPKEATDG